jgi:hypothetical protein
LLHKGRTIWIPSQGVTPLINTPLQIVHPAVAECQIKDKIPSHREQSTGTVWGGCVLCRSSPCNWRTNVASVLLKLLSVVASGGGCCLLLLLRSVNVAAYNRKNKRKINLKRTIDNRNNWLTNVASGLLRRFIFCCCWWLLLCFVVVARQFIVASRPPLEVIVGAEVEKN